MVHIFKIGRTSSRKSDLDVVKEGQTVRVKITGIDERGKINLTMIGL
ncbi:S1 RNA-binding domain-containing protein [Candidatus Minimicrobia naudis]